MLSAVRASMLDWACDCSLLRALELDSEIREIKKTVNISFSGFWIQSAKYTVISNWASVSEPHTCDFNATFSLYIYIYIYIYIYMRPSLYF